MKPQLLIKILFSISERLMIPNKLIQNMHVCNGHVKCSIIIIYRNLVKFLLSGLFVHFVL